MLNLRSIFMPKKRNASIAIADPSQQGAPNLGQLRQGTLPQQDIMNDPMKGFKKRLKQNSPISMSWLGGAQRTGSQKRFL